MRHTLAFSIAIAWLSAPTAHAQSLPVSAVETTPADAPRVSTLSASMTRARDAIDNARLRSGELALDEAVHAGLGPSDLLQWLEVSAMLAFADGRLGAMEDFLLGWASIAPTEVTVPTSMPGALRTRLNELRSEARIRVGAAPIQSFQSGVRRIAVPVQIRTDPGHLIRDLEVHVRIAEAPFAILAQGASIVVEGDVHEDARVQYFVVAHGPRWRSPSRRWAARRVPKRPRAKGYRLRRRRSPLGSSSLAPPCSSASQACSLGASSKTGDGTAAQC